MTMTKRQHYVPQFYMKYWLCDGSKNLYYLDIKSKRTGYCSPKAICYGDYQYEIGKVGNNYVCPNKFENKYGELETQVSNLLQKLFPILDLNDSSVLIFSPEEKEILRKFVLTTFLRNANLDMDSFLDYAYDENLQLYQNLINKLFSKRVDSDIMKNIVKNVAISSDMNWCEEDMLGGMLYRMLESPVKSLNIGILRSNNAFIFSDVPVHLEGHSIYMPLSPRYAIMYGRKKIILHPNKICDISYVDAVKMNRTYLMHVEECPCRYLYARDDKQGRQILDELKKEL